MKRLILIAVILATGMMVSVENGFSAYVVNPMEADLNGGAYNIYNVTNLDATNVVTTNITTKGPWVDVTAYASFSAAIDGIGAAKKTLLIPNQQAVTANKTVPANITLAFLRSGSLNISSGVTVTINGPLEAGLHQIFEGAGAVSLGSPGEVYPQWWGATADGTTDDSSEIQAAIDAGGSRIVFPKGTYNIGSATINLKEGIHLIGQGGIIPIHYSGNGAAFTNGTGGSAAIASVKMENFEIRHIGANTNAICLDIHDFYVSVFNNIYITKLSPTDANWAVGIQLRATFWGTYWNTISSFTIWNCNTGILFKDDVGAHIANSNFIRNGLVTAVNTGIDIEAGNNSNFIDNVDVEGATVAIDNKATSTVLGAIRIEGEGEIKTSGYPVFLPSAVGGTNALKIISTQQQVKSNNNLLVNGDFDIWNGGITNTEPTGWPGGGATGSNRGDDVPFSGYSLKLTRSGVDKQIYTRVPAEPNTYYTFTAWRKAGSVDVRALIIISDQNSANEVLRDYCTSTSWEKLTKVFKTGSHTELSVRLYVESPWGINGDTFYDRVALYKGFMPDDAEYNPNPVDYLLKEHLAQPSGIIVKTRMCWNSNAPSAGTWAAGDITWNTTPSGNVGWVCVTAGTPGTWLQFGLIRLVNSATWDPPSISTGRSSSKEVTVTGAEINDFAIASFQNDVQNLVLDAQVTAANTVTCVLSNTTGASVNLSSGLLYVVVIKK